MKSIGLTLLFIASITVAANAQVGLEMGLNMADLAIKSGGTSVATGFKPGFGMGTAADIGIGDGHLYFEPGLFFEMNGCKLTAGAGGNYSINTITIPVYLEYKSGEKCGKRFFFGAGPVIGNNMSGSYTINGSGGVPDQSGSFTIGSNAGDLKALDIGLGVNAGYQFRNGLYFRLHYQMGFANILGGGDGNNSIKSSAFGLTMGYIFRRCRTISFHSMGSERGDHWRGMSKGKYSRKPRYPIQ